MTITMLHTFSFVMISKAASIKMKLQNNRTSMLQVFDYHEKEIWHYFWQDNTFLIKRNSKENSLVYLKLLKLSGIAQLTLKSRCGRKFENRWKAELVYLLLKHLQRRFYHRIRFRGIVNFIGKNAFSPRYVNM